MPTTKIPLPDDPVQRRHFLKGMTAAHQSWTEEDILLARPVLSPGCDIFDTGYRLGVDMREKNQIRRRNLMKGFTGKVWRIFHKRDEAKARKDAIPELP